jgi:hypothetical protein
MSTVPTVARAARTHATMEHEREGDGDAGRADGGPRCSRSRRASPTAAPRLRPPRFDRSGCRSARAGRAWG